MAVAIDTSSLALDFIPRMQRYLDRVGGDEKRLQIHRASVYATILSDNSRQLYTEHHRAPDGTSNFDDAWVAKEEAVNWQADPDDDLGDAAVLYHLQQQAATIPLLSSVISQSDHGNVATTLTGSALSPSIIARTQGRLLSSFHRHSLRLSAVEFWEPETGSHGSGRKDNIRVLLFPYGVPVTDIFDFLHHVYDPHHQVIIWSGPERDANVVFWQMQVDVVDLLSSRIPTSRPRKRRPTTFNQFLQVSHSKAVEHTSRGNPPPQAKRFNGVRHRQDRHIWVADWKPPKHKTKQDFGNFKTVAEAARAVDAAFHHYGRPELLNFPDTSLQFLSTRPTAPAGLDEKAKVKFVKEEARLLVAATTASSPLHPTHTHSLQILELSASPRRSPSGDFRSLPEIFSAFCRSGPDEVHDVVSQPQGWMLHDSICDISTTGVVTNSRTLNSVQHAEQGWDGTGDSSTLVAPPNAVNPSPYESQSMLLDSIMRSSPAPMYSRSPSPVDFQDEIAYALLEHQSI